MANLDIFLTKLISAFLLLPLNLLVLSTLGLVLLTRHPRLGRLMLITTSLLLYVVSTPILVDALRKQAETVSPLDPTAPLPQADAIVVLSGGLYHKAPEYGGDTVNGYVLERMRYAARLYHLTGKPVLVTGGSWRDGARPEAEAMKESFEQDFHVPVQWVEDQSRTTLENAQFSTPILKQNGIQTVYLVTHAMHMSRARASFEKMGLTVVPAPTGFAGRKNISVLDFLPQGSSVEVSANVLHEWIGQLWYAIK